MERIRSLQYQGKLINYFDYRGLEDEASFLEMLHAASDFLENQNLQTLHLVNLTGVYITRGLITPILSEIDKLKPFVLKEAILGITGGKRILFQTYTTFFPGKIRSFVDETEALEWLVRG